MTTKEDLDKIKKELFNKKADENNTIDLNAYALGLDTMADFLVEHFKKEEVYTYDCKVCGKPFGDNLSLYEHYNSEHN